MSTAAGTRSTLLAVIAVLVVLAVGIAIAVSSGPDTAVSSGPITREEPPIDGGPTIVQPRPGMADVYARRFDSARANDDGTAVTVDFVSGVEPCNVLEHVDVHHGTDAVTITLFEGHDPNAGDVACIEIGVFKQVVVQLDEPLGDRAIIDGAA
jgi:hypothetical protein